MRFLLLVGLWEAKRRRALSDLWSCILFYFEHDAVGRQTAVLDALGQASRSFYDSLGRLVASKDVSGDRTYFEYDKAGNQTRVLDVNLHETSFAYDVLNRREGVTDAAGGKTYFEYDEVGNRTKVIDPRANAGTSAYDAVNRLIATTNAESETTYFAHDAVGNQTSVLDPNAHETLFGYDKLNRLEVTTDAETAKTYFEYDANGNRTKVTDARTHATAFGYDLLNRLNVTTDPLGGNTYFAHDAVGNQTSVIDPNANETQFAYDKLNRLQTTVDAESGKTYFEYDPLGNQTRVIDPNAHATGFQYAENRLEQTEDAEGRKTVFGYDPVGNKLLEATVVTGTAGYGAQSYGNTPYGGAAPAGYHPTYFEYDPLNRLAKTVDGIGNAQLFAYDPNSNLDAMTDGDGDTTYYAYDKVNRLTRKTFTNDPSQDFDYDPAGNILTALDARGTSYFEYDRVNRLLVETDPTGESVYFQWDAVGNRTAVTYPGTVGTAYYEYDANNRMVAASSPDAKTTYYQYDPAGNEIQRILGGGGHAYFEYDGRNIRTREEWIDKNGTPVLFREHTNDAAGRRIATDEGSGNAAYYEYDRGNWLIAYTRVGTDATTQYYEYDPAGNRSRLIKDGTATDSILDRANQLLREETGGQSTYYEYDKNGSTTRMAHPNGDNTYFEYDDRKMLQRAAYPGQSAIVPHYTAMGSLYALEEAGGTTTYFRYDPTRRMNLLLEQDDALNPAVVHTHGRSDIRGIATLVRSLRSGTGETPILELGQGNVSRILDDAAAQLMAASYGPWGVIQSHTGITPRNMFQSNWLKLRPTDTANNDYLPIAARIYRGEKGRFLGRDRLASSVNRYKALRNSPTNTVDPDGRIPRDERRRPLPEREQQPSLEIPEELRIENLPQEQQEAIRRVHEELLSFQSEIEGQTWDEQIETIIEEYLPIGGGLGGPRAVIEATPATTFAGQLAISERILRQNILLGDSYNRVTFNESCNDLSEERKLRFIFAHARACRAIKVALRLSEAGIDWSSLPVPNADYGRWARLYQGDRRRFHHVLETMNRRCNTTLTVACDNCCDTGVGAYINPDHVFTTESGFSQPFNICIPEFFRFRPGEMIVTLAHELGHYVPGEPGHPESGGRDEPGWDAEDIGSFLIYVVRQTYRPDLVVAPLR